MKAAVFKEYGPLEVLKQVEIPDPLPGRGKALVRIHAASTPLPFTITKYYGAEVTPVYSPGKAEFVRSLGADHVLDYTKEKPGKDQYDLIVATAGYNPISLYKAALKKGGVYVSTGGDMKQIFQAMFLGPLMSIFTGKKLSSMIVNVNRDLNALKEIIGTGGVKTAIDRCFPLNEATEALKYRGEGPSRSKVIIQVK